MSGYRSSFMPRPTMNSGTPPTPVVPRARVDSAVNEALEQAHRLKAALAEVETARIAVAMQMQALLAERGAADRFIAEFAAVREESGREYTLAYLLKIVATISGVPLRGILSSRRQLGVVRARQTFFWLARRFTARSLPELGRRCGGKDHTTVLHAVNKLEIIAQGLGEIPEEPIDWAKALLDAKWPDARRKRP